MVCNAVGNPTAVAGLGWAPQGRCHHHRPGAAGARRDRRGGGAGDAASQAEAVRQLPAKAERVRDRQQRRTRWTRVAENTRWTRAAENTRWARAARRRASNQKTKPFHEENQNVDG